ncbi:MAG: hypothetical protein K0S20_339 [Patescibacteria group bacterium]|jgi:hypothetical protein|nr:hypothetical protein [Patescibacteria group bacterium]
MFSPTTLQLAALAFLGLILWQSKKKRHEQRCEKVAIEMTKQLFKAMISMDDMHTERGMAALVCTQHKLTEAEKKRLFSRCVSYVNHQLRTQGSFTLYVDHKKDPWLMIVLRDGFGIDEPHAHLKYFREDFFISGSVKADALPIIDTPKQESLSFS